MKRNIQRFILVSFTILIALTLLTGCTTPAPVAPPTPSTYTLTIISDCGGCFGNVYVNGMPTGQYLPAWGGATVSGVPAGANIKLIDQLGWVSHTEILQPPNTTIIFN